MSPSGSVASDRAVIASPLPGHNIALSFSGELLCEVAFVAASEALLRPQSEVAAYALAQLELYFRNPRWPFDLPLLLQGSPFQQRVWQALREIPAGSTVTYGQLAWRLDSSARAVGSACRANPIPIVVPCHRVVAAGGIGGFMGQCEGREIAIKRWLLQYEHQGGL